MESGAELQKYVEKCYFITKHDYCVLNVRVKTFFFCFLHSGGGVVEGRVFTFRFVNYLNVFLVVSGWKLVPPPPLPHKIS